jgi:LNS2 (Lipin/Ned1/Smp2)
MRLLLLALALLAACSDDEQLTDATSLRCPTPDGLPFRLTSSGFQNAANKSLANDDPRNKDEASDTLGNPGGLNATIYAEDNQRPMTAAVTYRGAKARTTPTGGLLSSPFGGEAVSLWYYDADKQAWQSIARATTGADGIYDLSTTGFVTPNGKPLYAMLEADRTCAAHINALYPAGAKVIVTDIDATLTTEDPEVFNQVTDESYVPKMKASADRLMQAWAMKGYPIIYLTARPHVLRIETRRWLEDLGFPPGAVITAKAFLSDAAPYKTAWMKRMVEDFHWEVVAAYGNADTDIAAYANANVPKDRTFVIGPLAGSSGTVAIANNDYAAHISTFVAAQPANP